MISVADFEAARPRLTGVAFRLLGSIHDAEDAVQTTWLRAHTAAGEVDNSAAWLTTVVTRVCLDQLRMRRRRPEVPLEAATLTAAEIGADERYLVRENISRALMVVVSRLTPAQRVAYVLHDVFGVPFGDIARVLDTTPAAAKQHASRARRRIAPAERPVPTAAADAAVVEAFLAAAAGGDMAQLTALLAEDCRRDVDPALVAEGAPATLSGARAVAEETRLFTDRIAARTAMVVDGRLAHVLAPGGHPLAIVDAEVRGGLITRIRIRRVAPAMRLAMVAANANR